MPETFAGLVLCGGNSRRMGRPKPWLPFGRELLLSRVVGRLRSAVDTVVVVAAPGQDLPPLRPEVRRVDDADPGRGPLGGLAAGLALLAGTVEAAFVCPCDAPFLDPEFVRRLAAFLGNQDACVPRVQGRLHPLAALYRTGVAATARALLAQGSFGPIHLLEKVRCRIVEEQDLGDIDLRTLRNVNTPEEYAAALAEAEAE